MRSIETKQMILPFDPNKKGGLIKKGPMMKKEYSSNERAIIFNLGDEDQIETENVEVTHNLGGEG